MTSSLLRVFVPAGLLACVAFADATAQSCTTPVPGGPVTPTTWTIAGSPYCVTGDLRVSGLKIDPGVQVLVDGPYSIEVLTTITVEGTAERPVRFSTKLPGAPDLQRWKGLKFDDVGGGSLLRHCIVEFSDDSGITILDSSPLIESCVIRDNSTAGASGWTTGGGLHVELTNTDLELVDVQVLGNRANSDGGGIHAVLDAESSLAMVGGAISGNAANPSAGGGNYQGGGLYADGGSVSLTSTLVSDNTVFASCGLQCSIYAQGGGIYAINGNLALSNTTVRDNVAQAFGGGGLYGRGAAIRWGSTSGTLSVLNSNIACNDSRGEAREGSGIWANVGAVEIANSTLTRNATEGLWLGADATATIVNSILFDNDELFAVAQIAGPGVANVAYSDVEGGAAGTGNIERQPGFVGAGCSTDQLVPILGSFVADAGDPDSGANDLCFPPSQGTARNDMGAFGGPFACRWVGIEPDPEFFEAYRAQLDALGRAIPGQPNPVYAVTLDGTATGDVVATATGPLVAATGIEREGDNSIWVIDTVAGPTAEVPIAVGDLPGLIDLEDPTSARAGPFAQFFAVPRDLTDPAISTIRARVRARAVPLSAAAGSRAPAGAAFAAAASPEACARILVVDENNVASMSKCIELGEEFTEMVLNLLEDPLDPVVPGLLADLQRITGLRFAISATGPATMQSPRRLALDAVQVPEPDRALLSGTALLALPVLRRLLGRGGMRPARH